MAFKVTVSASDVERFHQERIAKEKAEKERRVQQRFSKYCGEHAMPRDPHCPMCILRSIEKGGGSPLTQGVTDFIAAHPGLPLGEATRQYWAELADKHKNQAGLVNIQ